MIGFFLQPKYGCGVSVRKAGNGIKLHIVAAECEARKAHRKPGLRTNCLS